MMKITIGRDGVRIARVGQFVQIDDSSVATLGCAANETAADESGTSGHKQCGRFRIHSGTQLLMACSSDSSIGKSGNPAVIAF